MKILAPLWVAIGFYSTIKVPNADWSEKNMKAAICFLPVVGLIIGGLLWLWSYVSVRFALNRTLFAAIAVILPLAVTGGIHMDGFMDCADAICSRQSRERKLEIMKDPHTGAFAVMWCAAYMLLCFGLYASVSNVLPVCVGFMLSRSLSALSALSLPGARKNGLLAAFTEHSRTILARFVMLILSLCLIALIYVINWKIGVCVTVAAGVIYAWYCRTALKQFGGATGDTSGFFLQICELGILAGAVVGGLI